MQRNEIEQILKDYHWMINSIKIMRKSLEQAGEGLTAQYGLEAAMPKAKGETSDPVHREVVRRGKRFKKIREFEEKILKFQGLFHKVSDERECEVLYWLLEGRSYRWIGHHMGLSFSHIKRIRDSIVDKLSFETNGTNGTDVTKLKKEKCAC
ncbi:DNA-binding response regulator [Siminovitchia sp. FSL W7-1587]|uniref:helix-turn-helix transcriptional regulator n=1 Tax=Siminovitchia sp. FSL W7-1587 TaxID=2954699 RepID=UPI0030CE2D1B